MIKHGLFIYRKINNKNTTTGKILTFSRVRLLKSLSSPFPSGCIHFGMDFPDILSKNSSEDTTEEQVRRIICTEDTRVVLCSWNFMAAKIRRLNFNIKPSYNIFNFISVPSFEVKKKYFVISNRSRHFQSSLR